MGGWCVNYSKDWEPSGKTNAVYSSCRYASTAKNSSFSRMLLRGIRNFGAGIALTLSACAGMPAQADYSALAKRAYEAYVELKEKGEKDAISIPALDAIDAHKCYRLAEDADQSSEQFAAELKETSAIGNAIVAKALSLIGNYDVFVKYEKLERDEGFLDDLSPEDKAQYEAALKKHSIERPIVNAPESMPPALPKLPTPGEQPNAGEQTGDKPKQAGATPPPQSAQPEAQKSVFEQDRIAVAFDIGSRRSSQDRGATVDLRGYCLNVLGRGVSGKYREDASDDKVRETGVGGYAKIDLDEAGLDKLTGIHLQAGVGTYIAKGKRGSEESGITEDSNFRITTKTETEQTDTNTLVSGLVKAKVSDTIIGLVAYKGTNETKVDVTTDLEVINKLDPAGSYTRLWTDNYVYNLKTVGGLASLEQVLSEKLSVGAFFGVDLKELTEMDRKIDQYTLDIFVKVLSEGKNRGLSLLVGQGLLDDNGEENDRFTKPRYSLVAGAELADWITIGGQFNRREDPDGSIMLLLGANNALPYLLNYKWQEHLSRLELMKEMHPELQKVYLEGLYNDLLWGIAQQNAFAVIVDAGARRVQTLDEKDKTVFNGRGTLFVPVTKDFTGTVTPFIEWENMSKRYGLNLGGHVVGRAWRFFVEASREKTDGRKEENEDFRAFGGVTFPF
ncbi:MAG: hypothetical protein QXR48_03125 [Candidatus Woesearchaeota archaeon]